MRIAGPSTIDGGPGLGTLWPERDPCQAVGAAAGGYARQAWNPGSKKMRSARLMRLAAMLATGAILLQFGGCTTTNAFDFIQTVLLGITAAGAVVIIQEV
jgi:hypothetical protein